jgi:RHS repeat-associated protein
MDGGQRWSGFRYDQNRDLLRREDMAMGTAGTTVTHFVDGAFEQTTRSDGTKERRSFVRDGNGVTIAIVSDAGAGAAGTTRYIYRDHLGSIHAITDAAGKVLERLSFDAFGKRRNPDWTPATGAIVSSLTKGFTGHEQLDSLGLIHMGGRVYDPELGRFTSADPVVQFPDDTQGLNRYAYVLNNPLTFVDPSGFSLSRFFKSIGKAFQKLAGVVGRATKVLGFVRSLACLASFGVGCLFEILNQALSVALEFGLTPKNRLTLSRTGTLIRTGASALGGTGRSQKIAGIGGEVDIDVGMPEPLDQWLERMRPGTILNVQDDEAEDGPAAMDAQDPTDIIFILDVTSVALELSVVGAPLSVIPDLISFGIALNRGDLVNAGASLAAVVPLLGTSVQTARVAAKGAKRLLPAVAKTTIDDVLASSSRLRSKDLTEGARALLKKQGRGADSAFSGIEPTQENAEALIRQILANPTSTAAGRQTLDAFNDAGQGVRIDLRTGRFIGFLEGALRTR